MRTPCVEAGLIPPLIQLLNSSDQEVLLQTGRALGNICYDSRECDCVCVDLSDPGLPAKAPLQTASRTETSGQPTGVAVGATESSLTLHMWVDPREVTWFRAVRLLLLSSSIISSVEILHQLCAASMKMAPVFHQSNTCNFYWPKANSSCLSMTPRIAQT